MTFYFSKLHFDLVATLFVFFGTLVSYNVIKYASFIIKHKTFKKTLISIIVLTIFGIFLCCYLFFKLSFDAKLITIFFGILSLLYVIPFGKRKSNLRNLAGIKIYIVSFCWAGVTLLIPLMNAEVSIELDVVFKFIQRYILTLILILIFEINDLKYDDVRLKTVPQSIGIQNTKLFIYLLCVPFYLLEFLKNNYYSNQWIVNLILIVVLAFLTFKASAERSKYYTLFWVESIPLLWYLLILITNKLN